MINEKFDKYLKIRRIIKKMERIKESDDSKNPNPQHYIGIYKAKTVLFINAIAFLFLSIIYKYISAPFIIEQLKHSIPSLAIDPSFNIFQLFSFSMIHSSSGVTFLPEYTYQILLLSIPIHILMAINIDIYLKRKVFENKKENKTFMTSFLPIFLGAFITSAVINYISGTFNNFLGNLMLSAMVFVFSALYLLFKFFTRYDKVTRKQIFSFKTIFYKGDKTKGLAAKYIKKIEILKNERDFIEKELVSDKNTMEALFDLKYNNSEKLNTLNHSENKAVEDILNLFKKNQIDNETEKERVENFLSKTFKNENELINM
tara:strand:- start:19736 stop:20683 length:948 start_codon:yes stop_codon:yes gene_type:complete